MIFINVCLLVSIYKQEEKKEIASFFWVLFSFFSFFLGLEEREAEWVFCCRFTGGLDLKDAIQVWVLP
jgi:hypothetical protein